MSPRVAAAYVLVVLIWGTTWAAIKVGIGSVPPWVFALERAIVVSVILTAVAVVLRQPFPRGRTALIATAVAGVFNIGTSWSLIFWAEQFVPSGLVALFGASFPVWTAVGAHFLVRGDRLSPLKVIGLVLGIAGTALLVAAPLSVDGPHVIAAVALLALMPVSWAVAAILSAKYLAKLSPIPVIAVQTWVGALFLLPFAAVQWRQPATYDVPYALAFGYLVLFGSCVGLSLNLWLYRKLRPTTVTLTQVLIPAQALLIGAVALGETITMRMLAGFALVAAAVLLNAIAGAGRTAPPRGEQAPVAPLQVPAAGAD